jgi:hypothetical protein
MSILAFLQWFGIKEDGFCPTGMAWNGEVGFVLTGMAWNVGSWFLTDGNVLEQGQLE